jgi:hypothetical protein
VGDPSALLFSLGTCSCKVLFIANRNKMNLTSGVRYNICDVTSTQVKFRLPWVCAEEIGLALWTAANLVRGLLVCVYIQGDARV